MQFIQPVTLLKRFMILSILIFIYKSRIADELEDVIKFCKDNKTVSIAVNYTVLTDDMIDRIKDNNLYLLALLLTMRFAEFLERGVDTICTNFIQ